MRVFILLLGAAVLLGPSHGATVREPSLVQIEGRQLFVRKRLQDGSLGPREAFIMRGVNWSPASGNTMTSPSDPNNVAIRRPEYAKWAATDIPLIKAMNANTVRVAMDFGVGSQDGSAGLAVLDACHTNGLMVIMTVDNGVNDTNRAAQAVRYYASHPAILMWSLGNEWNLNRYYGAASSVAEAARRTEAAAALVKSIDPGHPVVSSYGEIDMQETSLRLGDTLEHVNRTCRSVDIWSLNIYRGRSFGALFDQWRALSFKPMFLGEFGIDAFHSTAIANPSPPGAMNEAEQADWDAALWWHLDRNLSARDPGQAALGGCVHEFSDQWWKIAPATSQQTGGLVSDAFPDGMSSEEIFGIVDIDRKPRQAYDALKNAFSETATPPAGRTLIVTSARGDNSGGSLRQVLSQAGDGDTIVFDSELSGTISLGSELQISKSIAIAGPGPDILTISGNNFTRIFHVSSNALVKISGLNLSRGNVPDLGGAILNRGSLEVDGCRFFSNLAGGLATGAGQGGAIYNAGWLQVENCTFQDNRSTGNGGAIRSSGDVAVRRSQFSNNRCDFFGGAIFSLGAGLVHESVLTGSQASTGGAIWNEDEGLAIIGSTLHRNSASQGGGVGNKNGSLLVLSSTFSSNNATSGGGAIYTGAFNEGRGMAHVFNSTIVSNLASGTQPGGGIKVLSGGAVLGSSIVAANNWARSADHADLAGTFSSRGFNLIGSGSGGAGLSQGTNADQVGAVAARLNPMVGPLSDNGGATLTHAVAFGSPALDRGDSMSRLSDQRAEMLFDHPLVANEPSGDGADIGAYEAVQPHISATRFDGASLLIEHTSVLGLAYRLESRSDFNGGPWAGGPSQAGNGGRITQAVPAASSSRLFLRVVEQP